MSGSLFWVTGGEWGIYGALCWVAGVRWGIILCEWGWVGKHFGLVGVVGNERRWVGVSGCGCIV